MEFFKENLRSVGSIRSKSSHFSSFQNIRSVVTLCHSIVFFGRRSNEDGEYAYRSHNSIRTSRLLALTRYEHTSHCFSDRISFNSIHFQYIKISIK